MFVISDSDIAVNQPYMRGYDGQLNSKKWFGEDRGLGRVISLGVASGEFVEERDKSGSPDSFCRVVLPAKENILNNTHLQQGMHGFLYMQL